MKATLKFILPEEEKEFNRCSQATNLALALWDVDKLLRGIDKYGPDMEIGEMRKRFYGILERYDILLDNLLVGNN